MKQGTAKLAEVYCFIHEALRPVGKARRKIAAVPPSNSRPGSLSSHNPPILAVDFLVFCNLLASLSQIFSVISQPILQTIHALGDPIVMGYSWTCTPTASLYLFCSFPIKMSLESSANQLLQRTKVRGTFVRQRNSFMI